MRLQAEKDRLSRYKNIAVSQVSTYYNIIEQITKILDSRDDKLAILLQGIDVSKLGNDKKNEAVEFFGQEQNFQSIMRQVTNDSKLMMTLRYITEFIKQVIENGFEFNPNHFFILMLQLQPEQITFAMAEYLKIIVEAIGVSKPAFDSFMEGLNDEMLRKAFNRILSDLF